MFVLITGGRDFRDSKRVNNVLDRLFQDFPQAVIVEGGATGADRIAQWYCLSKGRKCITMYAPWEALGDAAGGIRNQWMLDVLPIKMVLHFPGGAGTADMVRKAKAQEVPTYAC